MCNHLDYRPLARIKVPFFLAEGFVQDQTMLEELLDLEQNTHIYYEI